MALSVCMHLLAFVIQWLHQRWCPCTVLGHTLHLNNFIYIQSLYKLLALAWNESEEIIPRQS